MAIPVYLQQFKAAGIYRVVWDRSNIVTQDTSIIRLVVGYSEKGPFNIPVYINSTADFKAYFGDISKKLEKRGVFFHRLALQMLQTAPILCLNLKKFSGEEVGAATISTEFNPNYEPIDEVKLKIEDVYTTTRFWELDASKLNNLKTTSGSEMDSYINISHTSEKADSMSYFIRKASGQKVSTYNITINDWYSDQTELPEYLASQTDALVSDFFAEIYVFRGKFEKNQVLSSSTLKNYFNVDKNGDLQLKPYVLNSYGEPMDTLDILYNDMTSNPVGHYMGALIPGFQDKKAGYISLDVQFNSDQKNHHMMMAFNEDLLEETPSIINLSGKNYLTEKTISEIFSQDITHTTLLGNIDSYIVYHKSTIGVDVVDDHYEAINPSSIVPKGSQYTLNGAYYVHDYDGDTKIELCQAGTNVNTVTLMMPTGTNVNKTAILAALGIQYDQSQSGDHAYAGSTTYYSKSSLYEGTSLEAGTLTQLIYGISRLTKSSSSVAAGTGTNSGTNTVVNDVYTISPDSNVSLHTVAYNVTNKYRDDVTDAEKNNVYGASLSYISLAKTTYVWGTKQINNVYEDVLYGNNQSVLSLVSVGDSFAGEDTEVNQEKEAQLAQVLSKGTTDDDYYYIKFSSKPYLMNPGTVDSDKYLVRVDSELNKEIGIMKPVYIEGYTYKNSKPESTSMKAKLDWQESIISTLVDYKGLRAALLNKSEIDYRYIVDTFETYPDEEIKAPFAELAKDKQSAFCIANFPAVQSFVKCPYISFTDENNIFNVKYVAEGNNKMKPSSLKFTLPTETSGASFVAFYTPIKYSDGYIDTIVPSAGLVSNLFVEKYMTRQPYYIVAGPNYGNISGANIIGPDYRYSKDELQIIEPFGVNCLVYRPNFGTFINANQTAKQIPVSALSRVNVRELVIYLQDEIERVLQQYQWEFNNSVTRGAILDKANTICELIRANGGIQAYRNVMDESNNGPEIIDNEMAVLSTYIEPGFGCGKMVQELTIYRTGQLSASVSE